MCATTVQIAAGVDAVVVGVLLGLLTILLTGAGLLVIRLRDQHKLLRGAPAVADRFWGAASLYDAVLGLEGGHPFRGVVEAALRAQEQPAARLAAQIGVVERIDCGITRAVDRWDTRLRSGMSLVACLAIIAPWIGLLGAGWCMRRALAGATLDHQQLPELTAALDQALAMAVLGIAVAVPLLLSHQFVISRRRRAMRALRDFALDARSLLVNGAATGLPDLGR